MRARSTVRVALLVLLACAPQDAAAPAAGPQVVRVSLHVDEPRPTLARAPRHELGDDLTRTHGDGTRLGIHAQDGSAVDVEVGLSNHLGGKLHLAWRRGSARDEQGRIARRDVTHRGERDEPLAFLPTALCRRAARGDTLFVAGWDPDTDRCLVQVVTLDLQGWLAAPDADGPSMTRRSLAHSEPGGGVLARSMVCHPRANRLVLLPAGDQPVLHALGLGGGEPYPLELDGAALHGVGSLRGGRVASDVLGDSFAIIGSPATPAMTTAGPGLGACATCMLIPQLSHLVMLDRGADGDFELLAHYGDDTFSNLGLAFDEADDGGLP